MTGALTDDSTLDLPAPDTRPRADRAPALTVLWHADARRVGDQAHLAAASLLGEGLWLSRLEPIFVGPDGSGPLADPYVSRTAARIRSDRGQTLVLSAEAAAGVEVDGAPLDGALALPAARWRGGVVIVLARRVALVLHAAGPRTPDDDDLGLVGGSDGLLALREATRRVAGVDVPVLVRGESGTGKELVARALHTCSPRAGRPFVAVNMATLTPGTAASELFGHVKGAFTGASSPRPGTSSRPTAARSCSTRLAPPPPRCRRCSSGSSRPPS